MEKNCNKLLFKGFLGGASYVACGDATLKYEIKDIAPGKIEIGKIEWDSIRLNMTDKWYFYFNDIPAIHNKIKSPVKMYLSIKLTEAPVTGISNSYFFYKPRLDIKLYSPQRIITDKESKENEQYLGKTTFHKGYITFVKAEPFLIGKLKGNFEFSGSSANIKDNFDIVFKESPPISL